MTTVATFTVDFPGPPRVVVDLPEAWKVNPYVQDSALTAHTDTPTEGFTANVHVQHQPITPAGAHETLDQAEARLIEAGSTVTRTTSLEIGYENRLFAHDRTIEAASLSHVQLIVASPSINPDVWFLTHVTGTALGSDSSSCAEIASIVESVRLVAPNAEG